MNQQLTSRVAAVVAVMALTGASAFADSRPSNETRGRGQRGDSSRHTRSADRSPSRGGNDSSRSAPSRGYDRNRDNSQSRGNDRSWNNTNRNRSTDSRSYDNRSYDDRSNGNRSYDRGGNNNNRSYDRGRNGGNDGNNGNNWRGGRSYPSNRGNSYGNRQPYYTHGRVERISPFNGGFRVWIGGAPFPFFVPSAYYYRNHFRIGLTIGLGGYYNPLGYYDYYDGYDRGSYDDRAYIDARGYSNGTLRGTVESVDYRRNTFVLRNEASGSFVTIEMRQRLTDIRAGDYVELSGDWTRNGVFEAYTADLLNGGDRNRDDQYRDDQYRDDQNRR